MASTETSNSDRSTDGTFTPRPLPSPKDQVRMEILRAIEAGELQAGDRLPSEAETARGFGVSRSAVREGLQSLAQVGVIRTVPGRGGGSFVDRLEAEPVERRLTEGMRLLLRFDGINTAEVSDARRALEGVCAELAAQRRTDEHVDTMIGILDAASDPSLSEQEWLALDIQFHRTVVQAANNRVLEVPLAALHRIAQPRLNETIRRYLDRTAVNDQHRGIQEAIRAGDPAAARAAVNRHVDYLDDLYEKAGLLHSEQRGT